MPRSGKEKANHKGGMKRLKSWHALTKLRLGKHPQPKKAGVHELKEKTGLEKGHLKKGPRGRILVKG